MNVKETPNCLEEKVNTTIGWKTVTGFSPQSKSKR